MTTTPEAHRKFHMWKATTSAIMLESMDDDERENQNIATWARELSGSVVDTISPWIQDSTEGIRENLAEIIRSSIILDQKICRQSARVDWLFPPSNSPLSFDPDSMAVDAEMGQRVSMVVAPGLKKRGTSTGENFEIESLLLKMEVFCH
jgi:hypothetical protein